MQSPGDRLPLLRAMTINKTCEITVFPMPFLRNDFVVAYARVGAGEIICKSDQLPVRCSRLR